MKLNHRAEILTIRLGCPETVAVTVDTMHQDGATVTGDLTIAGRGCRYTCSKDRFQVDERDPETLSPAQYFIESDRFMVALMREVLECREKNHAKLSHTGRRYHGR